MAQSTTVVSLPQMVDLALNTPEVGIVNFTVLHSLLHVIISQLNMDDIRVEFRGQDSERIQNFVSSAIVPNRTLVLSQYTVEGVEQEIKHSDIDKTEVRDKSQNKDKDKGKDRAEIDKDKTISKATDKTKDKTTGKSIDKTKDKEKSQTVILVESSKGSINGGQFTIAVSKTHFNNLEQEVEDLKRLVTEMTDLPNNQALMDAIKKGDSTSPVLDMFQLINLQKRIGATEVILEKMGGMFEDFIRGTGQESIVGRDALTEMHELRETLAIVDLDRSPSLNNEKKLSTSSDKRGSKASEKKYSKASSFSVSPSLEIRVKHLEKIVDHLISRRKSGEISEGSTVELQDDSKSQIQDSGGKGAGSAKDLKHYVNDAVETMQNQIQVIDENTSHLMKDMDDLKYILNANSDSQPLEMRLKLMETKYSDLMETVNSLDGGFKRQVNALQNRLVDLEKQFGEWLEKGNISTEESAKMETNITAELHNQLMAIQDDVSVLSEQMQKILEEYESRQHSLDVVVEQIELLKTVKADREDLEDALADKADACLINRKVSFEQFDQACGDMTRSIEEALAKLTQQESLWSQALEDIQKNVGSKLDRIELNPLRDFISQKLKNLQDRFKTLTALKKENEAAGTKSKYLRNVNCISCDKDVVMRKEMDPSLYPKPYALPPTRSMGPYLAYELDQLRKQQKCLPNAKNMNVFENALQTSKTARSPDHICNRYCGGSHTLTTPTQRVTRLGHFLEQWGPEIAPVNDMNVRGTDGQMYKGRDDQALHQLVLEKPPTPHPEQRPAIHISGVGEGTKMPSLPDVSTNTARSSKDPYQTDKSPKSLGQNEYSPPDLKRSQLSPKSTPDNKKSS